jgi:hypothetical protein
VVTKALSVGGNVGAPSSDLQVPLADPGTQRLFKSQVGATGGGFLLVWVQACKSQVSAPQLPRGFVRARLTGPEKFGLRAGSVAFPNAVKDTVTSRVADFGEALDLKKQSTKIDLVDGAKSEVVAEDVVHQDAVVGT